nr:MAG TPA: hypothetical protein [Caudoviricetes sp.]
MPFNRMLNLSYLSFAVKTNHPPFIFVFVEDKGLEPLCCKLPISLLRHNTVLIL